ncbi:hypothetical protein [Streptomyces sp. NPDC051577]|uniref:hypothetical protein n=1 Tax=Streptomyces sp. NPDC051577 TaxID=3155166 RepID=UPI003448F432
MKTDTVPALWWVAAGIRRWTARVDRGTLRAAGFVALLTLVFLVTNTSVAMAADGATSGGGLLGPLDVYSSEGAPLSGYQLESLSPNVGRTPAEVAITTGGMPYDVVGELQRMVMGGLFTLVRLLVGLACWLIGFVFRFPITTLLTDPAQKLADAYARHVVAPLGIQGLFLAWAFAFGLILFVRGKVGTGLGEIMLTLFIVAFAASAFVRPDYLLGKEGPVAQTHRAAIEVASITTTSYFGGPDSCATGTGPPNPGCLKERERVRSDPKTTTGPIQNALTDALVVKPYMLLQYGRVLNPKDVNEKPAYAAHVKWVKSNHEPRKKPGEAAITDEARENCEGTFGPIKDNCERNQTDFPPDATPSEDCRLLPDWSPAKKYCERSAAEGKAENPCRDLNGPSLDYCLSDNDPCAKLDEEAKPYCESGNGPARNVTFEQHITNLKAAGAAGKLCAEFAQKATWERVWSVVALLIAVIVVTLMVLSMSVVMLGAQGAEAAAAAAGPIAWVWSMLPGPSRMLLWRWVGVFIVSAMVSFVAAMALPMFGIAVNAVLADSGPDVMVERLLLVDAIAVAFLIMHRRILASTAGFGQRLATRMRYKKVGGSHLTGDNSEIGAAIGLHGADRSSGAGTGLGLGLGLRGSIGTLAAMADGAGTPMSPGRLLGDALAEGRRGFAPVAMLLRGAHTALIGPKPARHPAGALLSSVAGNGPAGAQGARGEMVVDEWTGQILHDPATDRPLLGSRIHARASRLRGYRVAARTARVGYGATMALPDTLRRASVATSEFTTDVRQQLDVAHHRLREDAASWQPLIDGTHEAGQLAHRGIRDTAISAAIYTSTPTAPEAAPRPRAGITRLATPPGGASGSMPAPSRIRPTSRPDLATRIPSTPLSTPIPRSTSAPRPATAAPATPGSFQTEATPRPEPIRPRPATPSPYTPAPTGDARPTPHPAPESQADNTGSENADRLRRRFQEQADAARRRREADRTDGGDQ